MVSSQRGAAFIEAAIGLPLFAFIAFTTLNTLFNLNQMITIQDSLRRSSFEVMKIGAFDETVCQQTRDIIYSSLSADNIQVADLDVQINLISSNPARLNIEINKDRGHFNILPVKVSSTAILKRGLINNISSCNGRRNHVPTW